MNYNYLLSKWPFFLFTFVLLSFQGTPNLSFAEKSVIIETNKGTIELGLYNETPLHRDNFLKLVRDRYFDSLLFHRVISGFVIQAGDPNSKSATASTVLGSGGLPYTIPAEILPQAFHKRGSLGAARLGDTENPTRASSACQFYIVQGKKHTDKELDSVEIKRLGGKKISPERRTIYQEMGGTPQLDAQYTVFGEVLNGMNVVDSIAKVATTGKPTDRPLEEIRILKVYLKKRK